MHELDDFIKHYGVPGMKWGVRKADTGSRIKVSPTSSTRQKAPSGAAGVAAALAGTPLFVPAATAAAIGSVNRNRKAKLKVADALGMSPKDFNKKDLKMASKVVQSLEYVEYESNGKRITMSDVLDDSLQHYGVKGMKWGVRKKSKRQIRKAKNKQVNADRKAGKISRSEAKIQKLENYHTSKKHKVISTYKENYKDARRLGSPHIKAVKQAKRASRASKAAIGLNFAVGAFLITDAGNKGMDAFNKSYNKVTDPKTVRYGKNLIQKAKRSNIRYVDGTNLENVIGVNFKDRIDQWSALETEDTLQHYGVKGMKWGVRKAGKAAQRGIKKSIKRANARENRQLNKYHDKKMNTKNPRHKAIYEKTYNRISKRRGHKAAVRAIYNKEAQVKRARLTMLATTGAIFAPEVKRVAKPYVRAAYNKATSPEAVRLGKNIILAAKRSKLRVVDPSTMENVLKATLNNRIDQWSALETEDTLQHYGVKGMKWGVIRSESAKAAARGANRVKKSRVGEEAGSLKREMQWKKTLKNINKLSTDDMNTASRRLQQENELKRLSKNKKIGSSKDRKDYRTRANLSDSELNTKVVRLRAKANLRRNVEEANKVQYKVGKQIVTTAGPLVLTYALNRTLNQEDFKRAVNNNKDFKTDAKDRAMSYAGKKTMDAILNRLGS